MEINLEKLNKWIDEEVEEDTNFPLRKISMKNFALYFKSYLQTNDENYKKELNKKMLELADKITTEGDRLTLNGLWARFHRRIDGDYTDPKLSEIGYTTAINEVERFYQKNKIETISKEIQESYNKMMEFDKAYKNKETSLKIARNLRYNIYYE